MPRPPDDRSFHPKEQSSGSTPIGSVPLFTDRPKGRRRPTSTGAVVPARAERFGGRPLVASRGSPTAPPTAAAADVRAPLARNVRRSRGVIGFAHLCGAAVAENCGTCRGHRDPDRHVHVGQDPAGAVARPRPVLYGERPRQGVEIAPVHGAAEEVNGGVRNGADAVHPAVGDEERPVGPESQALGVVHLGRDAGGRQPVHEIRVVPRSHHADDGLHVPGTDGRAVVRAAVDGHLDHGLIPVVGDHHITGAIDGHGDRTPDVRRPGRPAGHRPTCPRADHVVEVSRQHGLPVEVGRRRRHHAHQAVRRVGNEQVPGGIDRHPGRLIERALCVASSPAPPSPGRPVPATVTGMWGEPLPPGEIMSTLSALATATKTSPR